MKCEEVMSENRVFEPFMGGYFSDRVSEWQKDEEKKGEISSKNLE